MASIHGEIHISIRENFTWRDGAALRAPATLPEDPRLEFSIHQGQLTTACNSRPRNSDAFFQPPWHPQHKHTIKNKIKWNRIKQDISMCLCPYFIFQPPYSSMTLILEDYISISTSTTTSTSITTSTSTCIYILRKIISTTENHLWNIQEHDFSEGISYLCRCTYTGWKATLLIWKILIIEA